MSDTIFFISVIAGFIVILFVVIRFVKNDAVETNELESDDIARRESVDTLIEELKKKAGKDAQIYSYKTDYEWVCVCSCRNVLDEEKEIQKCTGCNRDRDFTLENYSEIAANPQISSENETDKSLSVTNNVLGEIFGSVGSLSFMSGILLICYQAYLWIEHGAWPDWPLSYLFFDPTSHILNTSTSEQEIKASLAILKLTPSFFYDYFKNSWLLNPKTLYGLHKLTVKLLDSFSIPALLLVASIIVFF